MNLCAKATLIVTFDLGGVVVRVCPSTALAAKRAGVPWRDLHHPEQPDEIERLLHAWQVGGLDDESFFEAWSHAMGGRFDAAEARSMSSSWLMGEYEGIREIADRISSKGIRLGCLSNTCNHHWQHMLGHPMQYPTLALLTERHGSHSLGHMKPDPAIYQRFEDAVGARGTDVVYFDDALVNVEGALARNWRAFHIEPERAPFEQVNDSLLELGIL